MIQNLLLEHIINIVTSHSFHLCTSGGGHVKTGTFCENGSSLACASNDGLIALIKLRTIPYLM